MKKIFQILNGDCLKEEFPTDIPGTQIIMRECLLDGPVDHSLDPASLSNFYKIRSSFIADNYKIDKSIYQNTTIPEIELIRNIPDRSQVYVWFEDDLFCQVNLWFVSYLLSSKNGLMVSLVRPPLAYSNTELPTTILQNGFGGLDTNLLQSAFFNTTVLQNESLLNFGLLWTAYQARNENKLLQISNEMNNLHDFIPSACKALIDLWNGHPTQLLQQIIQDLKTDNFGKIFQEFKKRGAIYGLGDLQVKRLLGDII